VTDSQVPKSITVLMQTVKPTRTWSASASSPRGPWTIDEVFAGKDLWKSEPICLRGRIIGITGHHQLVGNPVAGAPENSQDSVQRIGISSQPMNSWMFSNFATGQTVPYAFSRRSELLVVADGMQLVSFDPSTGSRKWTADLADFPLKSPESQIGDHNSRIFATSQGQLRGISMIDGKVQVQNYLGDISPQWRTVVAWLPRDNQMLSPSSQGSVALSANRGLIATWPINSDKSRPTAIRFCDAETGTVRQQFQVDAEPKALVLNHVGDGFVWMDGTITGLRFAPSAVVADADRSPRGSRP
jgi:outer membrane protein assembly factor BamB